jgi:hypothetical protein
MPPPTRTLPLRTCPVPLELLIPCEPLAEFCCDGGDSMFGVPLPELGCVEGGPRDQADEPVDGGLARLLGGAGGVLIVVIEC